MSLNKEEIQEISQHFSDIVDAECERSFRLWKELVISASKSHGLAPSSLTENLEIFCEEKKHLFWRGFKNKLVEKIKQSMKYRPDPGPKNMTHKEQKDRLFLEAYLMADENGPKAAEQVGVDRKTFYRWLAKNQEMVLAEKYKSRPKVDRPISETVP